MRFEEPSGCKIVEKKQTQCFSYAVFFMMINNASIDKHKDRPVPRFSNQSKIFVFYMKYNTLSDVT